MDPGKNRGKNLANLPFEFSGLSPAEAQPVHLFVLSVSLWLYLSTGKLVYRGKKLASSVVFTEPASFFVFVFCI